MFGQTAVEIAINNSEPNNSDASKQKLEQEDSPATYRHERVCFCKSRCVVFFTRTAKNTVDLILTDPPYVISRKTGFESCVHGVERFKVSMDFGSWDQEDAFTIHMLSEIVQECFQILKKGGTLIMFYDLWKIQELKESMDSQIQANSFGGMAKNKSCSFKQSTKLSHKC